MHHFLSPIYNIEFVRIRLEPYAFEANIVCSHEVSVLLMYYLEGFINQLFIGHFVFRFERYEECLRARSSDLLQYLGSRAKFEVYLRFLAGLDLLRSDRYGSVIGWSTCSENQIGRSPLEFPKNRFQKLTSTLNSNRLNARRRIYRSGT